MLRLNEFAQENRNKDWTEILQQLYSDSWFREKLERSARHVLRQTGMPPGWREDIKQEALIIFARALQRDPTLGFDGSRGAPKPFLSTIIYRCCQKGIRQFRHSMNRTLECESKHPFFDPRQGLDEHLDLSTCLKRLDEPFRSTALRVAHGHSVEEIAASTDRSLRTVYRHLERATQQLRAQMQTGHAHPHLHDVSPTLYER